MQLFQVKHFKFRINDNCQSRAESGTTHIMSIPLLVHSFSRCITVFVIWPKICRQQPVWISSKNKTTLNGFAPLSFQPRRWTGVTLIQQPIRKSMLSPYSTHTVYTHSNLSVVFMVFVRLFRTLSLSPRYSNTPHALHRKLFTDKYRAQYNLYFDNCLMALSVKNGSKHKNSHSSKI